MKKIKGRIVLDNDEAEYGEWTVEEIADFAREGRYQMLLLSGYYLGEKKDGRYASASALTLFPKETIPVLQGEDIVIPTKFRNHFLPRELQTDNEDDLVSVDCVVSLNDERLFVTIDKMQEDKQ